MNSVRFAALTRTDGLLALRIRMTRGETPTLPRSNSSATHLFSTILRGNYGVYPQGVALFWYEPGPVDLEKRCRFEMPE
jgi:hypothetical protein